MKRNLAILLVPLLVTGWFVLWAIAGCAVKGKKSPTARPASPHRCKAEFSKNESLLIDGRPTGIHVQQLREAYDETNQRTDEDEGVIPWVGVSKVMAGVFIGVSGHLLRIACQAPYRSTVFFRLEGAEFHRGKLTGDGRTLFFTEGGAISALDLVKKRKQDVVKRHVFRGCWDNGHSMESSDRVLKVNQDGTELIIQRSAPCGYEGDVTSFIEKVIHPLDPARRRLTATYPVSTIVVDAAGTLWLGVAVVWERSMECGVRKTAAATGNRFTLPGCAQGQS